MLADILKRSEVFVGENSSTILTAIGVTGTVTTAVLTGRASIKAHLLIEDLANQDISAGPITRKEIIQETWTVFIPPIGVGVGTIASIIMANHLSSKKAAALAAAYGLSERAFQEYREKIVTKLGETKANAVRDEIAQDRVNKQPPTREVIIAGAGEVLCFDMLSGRYFQSSVEKIRKAENDMNADIFNQMYVSLSDFYDKVGLPPTMFSEEVGFNTEHHVDISFSTTMSPDDRPCVAISFATGPVQNYRNLY